MWEEAHHLSRRRCGGWKSPTPSSSQCGGRWTGGKGRGRNLRTVCRPAAPLGLLHSPHTTEKMDRHLPSKKTEQAGEEVAAGAGLRPRR